MPDVYWENQKLNKSGNQRFIYAVGEAVLFLFPPSHQTF